MHTVFAVHLLKDIFCCSHFQMIMFENKSWNRSNTICQRNFFQSALQKIRFCKSNKSLGSNPKISHGKRAASARPWPQSANAHLLQSIF